MVSLCHVWQCHQGPAWPGAPCARTVLKSWTELGTRGQSPAHRAVPVPGWPLGCPTGGTGQNPQPRSRQRALKALIFAKLFLLPGSSPSSPIFCSTGAGSSPLWAPPGRCRGAEELQQAQHITTTSTPKPSQSVKPVWPIQLHHSLCPSGALEQSCKPGLCWEITPGRQNTPNPSLWVLECRPGSWEAVPRHCKPFYKQN